MLHINIISQFPQKLFYAQWDKETYPSSEYDVLENSSKDINWDCVVVYDNNGNINHVRCKKGGLIFVAGEPPLMRPYPKSFLKQFDIVIMPHKNIKHPHHIRSHGFLNWLLGFGHISKCNKFTFSDIKYINPVKSKTISIITSSKRMMPGHVKRLEIINRLKKDFPKQIDYYGVGDNVIDFKSDALIPYYFHICMENCSVPYYWTEKFADPILCNTVPIYAGCKNIDEYFHKKGYLSFEYNDYTSLKKIIKRILADPQKEYEKYYNGLCETKKTIMEKENLIPYIIKLISSNNITKNPILDITIKSPMMYISYKYMSMYIKIRRYVIRLIS